MEDLLDPVTRRFKFWSLEAGAFALYFAVVNGISSQECLEHFGEDKQILLERYKRNTEVALVNADFLNSLELTTLQAFIIYIVSTSHLATQSKMDAFQAIHNRGNIH